MIFSYRFRFVLSAIILCFVSLPVFAQSNLTYDVVYKPNKFKSVMFISLSFRGDPTGKTIIELPSTVSGIADLYKNVSNIHVEGATYKQLAKPNLYLLSYKPNSNIVFSYQAQQGWVGPPVNHNKFRAPILQNNYFQFKGESVFAYPQSYEKEKQIAVTMNWHVPKGWTLANSYGANQLHQTFKVDPIYFAESLFLSGDFRLYQNNIKGGQVFTAIRGEWKFKDKEFNNTVVKIISTERNFWNDYRFPYYLVSLIQIGTKCNSRAGTALNNAFSVFLPSDCDLNNDVIFLISHEYFHTWNKGLLFQLKQNEDEKIYDWFFEGFTNYYAHLLDLRAGLINFEDYINQYNKMLVDYYSSPANHANVDLVIKNFWKDNNIQLLPYQQGEILAHNWNAQIKQATHNKKTLDDLMKRFINPLHSENSQLTPQKMDELAKQFSLYGVMNDIKHINQGDLIVPNKNSLGPCVYQVNQMLASKKGNGKLILTPQFMLNKKMWKQEPKTCLGWFGV